MHRYCSLRLEHRDIALDIVRVLPTAYELTGQRSKLTFLKNKDKDDHCLGQFLIKNDRLRRLNFSNSGSIEDEVGALLLKVLQWKHQGVLP